jgi:biotin carboxylase/acetyl-CoA carboxylase carboxyltransferase component/biotin carboxyl carrier protein
LIANNGLAATKAIRSIKKWAYDTFGDEKTIQFIAMATPDDLKANAEFIRLADEYVNVPGGSNNLNYANIRLITELAENVKAHAVWPGWGHASEKPELPEALYKTKNGVKWIGPPPDAMRALGDKIGSTIIAQGAGVPCMGWSGDGITVDYKKDKIPQDVYEQACVKDAAHAREVATRIGYPVMIKASEGGGGKGIRKAEEGDNIEMLFGQVIGEVPGSPVFIMRLSPVCRHLEVQLLADEYGDAIALFGRDCSIQRRHQKIIEEGPVVAAPPQIWRCMEQSAVALAKEVGYCGAGTVEYLFTPDNKYYFLELNPRLQVEHPVTELITGVSLPASQLMVAMGIPLASISPIRKLYGENGDETSRIDFDNREMQPLPGHVIACRITAENPDQFFQPTSGLLQELTFRSSPKVWGYFSVAPTGNVHEFSDSQFGHLFAWGDNREVSRQNMSNALRELAIRGDIRTTTEYLRGILEHEDFKENKLSTTWLERAHKAGVVTCVKPAPILSVLLGTVFRSHSLFEAKNSEFMSTLGRGAIPSRALYDSLVRCESNLILDDIKYTFKVSKSGPRSFDISASDSKKADWSTSATCLVLSDKALLIQLDGKKYVVYGQEFPSGLRLTVDGQTVLFKEEYDPTRLVSSMQAKLVRWIVDDGAHVAKGSPFAEVEVMKMYLSLNAPESGRIAHVKPAGSVLEAGQLIGTMSLDNPQMVQRAEVFSGSLPVMGDPAPLGSKPNLVLQAGLEKLNNLLSGFQLGPGVVSSVLKDIMVALRSPELPLFQFKDKLSNIEARIPEELKKRLEAIADGYANACTASRFSWEPIQDFPAIELQSAIENQKRDPKCDRSVLTRTLDGSGIPTLLQDYRAGNHAYVATVLVQLLNDFFKVEKNFSELEGVSDDDIVRRLLTDRARYPLEEVARIARARSLLKPRSALVESILDLIDKALWPLMKDFLDVVNKLSNLVGHPAYAVLTNASRQLNSRFTLPSFSERRLQLLTLLQTCNAASRQDRPARLAAVTEHSVPITDMIFSFLQDTQPDIMQIALESYVRRVYQAYKIQKVTVEPDANGTETICCNWEFFLEAQSESYADFAASGGPSYRNLARSQAFTPITGLSKFSKIMSVSDLASLPQAVLDEKVPMPLIRQDSDMSHSRKGLLLYFKDSGTLETQLSTVLESYTSEWKNNSSEAVNVLYLMLPGQRLPTLDNELCEFFQNLVIRHRNLFVNAGMRRVTFVVGTADAAQPVTEVAPLYFTFRHQDGTYTEDSKIRHVEPSHAVHMQMVRLDNYDIQYIPTNDRKVHLFEGIPKEYAPSSDRDKYDGRSLYARVMIRKLESTSLQLYSKAETLSLNAYPEIEYSFVAALNALETAIAGNSKKWRYNHIFINVLVTSYLLNPSFVANIVRALSRRYADKVRRLNVSELELAMLLAPKNGQGPASRYHFFCTTPTREVLNIALLKVVDEIDGLPAHFEFVSDFEAGQQPDEVHYLHGKLLREPYPTTSPLRRQRELAWAHDTIYVYDFLPILKKAVAKIWFRQAESAMSNRRRRKSTTSLAEIDGGSPPDEYFSAVELVVDSDAKEPCLKEVQRAPGSNNIGMVAWRIRLKTIEYPQGREILVVANDISFQHGTFGVKESQLFALASQYARARGIPRIYFAANSGARIGLAEELRNKYKIAWINGDIAKGMDYIYLSDSDYNSMKDSVIVERVEVVPESKTEVRETRWILKGIVGKGESLGVENLSGSGLIAGETTMAYDQVYTLTICTGNSVGIGAYLARLGQRVIQKKTKPLLLTGYEALNKLLGRTVYRSNLQLGGIDIMHTNGVTHLVCENDMTGILQMLQLLSYVPERRGFPLPVSPVLLDPVDRRVEFTPQLGEACDVRKMLAGDIKDEKWVSGLFDYGSFYEILGGWAKSIVTGRARLGGIPLGVIAVETRQTENIRPADPANPESKEEVKPRAPLVWFSDSSYKTAQAIADLRGEDLPLMIFANWRGFSGGATDMFDEILKFGSMIVDNLRHYEHPVFVYLPPFAQLRGGAWVVLDSQINKSVIEMYAAPEARGGVLEAEGTAEIKFKKDQLIKSMRRLDTKLVSMYAERDAAIAEFNKTLKADGKAEVDFDDPQTGTKSKNATYSDSVLTKIAALYNQIVARQELLLPYYHTVGAHFCDLHDTPGRMKAKGVIREIVNWAGSRQYFYWRLRRRLVEDTLVRDILRALKGPLQGLETKPEDLDTQWARALSYVRSWQAEDLKTDVVTDADIVEWRSRFEQSLGDRVENLRVGQVRKIFRDENYLNQLVRLIADLEPDQITQLQKSVTQAKRN